MTPARRPSRSRTERWADAPMGVARLDRDGRIRVANEALRALVGDDPSGRPLAELVSADERAGVQAWVVARFGASDAAVPDTIEQSLLVQGGGRERVVFSADRRDAQAGRELVVRVVTAAGLRRIAQVHLAQDRVLQLIVSGAPLVDVLVEALRTAQELLPGMRGGVLLMSDDGTHLRLGAAPDLPDFFTAEHEGLPVREGLGSCGTAAATGRAHIAEDLETDPYWADYRELTRRAGLRSCWSEPILSSRGAVLGTCAFYDSEPSRPGPADQEAIRGLAHLLAVAIERCSIEGSRERLADDVRTTLGTLGDAVLVVDGAGRVRELNAVAESLLGEGVAGQPLADVLSLRERGSGQLLDDPLDVSRGHPDTSRPFELTTRDGSLHVVSVGGAELTRDEPAPPERVVVLRDISAEVELAARLRHASKMEAIGELAGGVAHDFNNLLTGILSNAELLRGRVDPGDGRLLDQILTAADRAAQLTRQLLSFSRKGRLRSLPVDVHALIAELVDLLARSIDPRILLEQSLAARQPRVLGDPGELHNALLNLCLNARDAMPEGGRLTLTTRNLELSAAACLELASEAELTPGPYVEVGVRDTGTGMTREVAARVFEPYFTTKAPGAGTGLGLSGVYGCVHSHHGLIEVRSTPGHGSLFRVLLPVTAAAYEQRHAPVSSLPHGDGHVLLVDDEALVRSSSRRLLEELGYQVTACQDGIEAVDVLARSDSRVDLVLLDMVMPRLDGLGTLRRLRRAGIDVPVVLCTGHTGRGRAQAALDEGALALLSKPFRMAELADVVARHCRQRGDGHERDMQAS